MTEALGAPAATVPRLKTTRRLVGASFDLLARATEETRRASFYVGCIVLGLVAPFALATWTIQVRTIHLTIAETTALSSSAATGWYDLLAWPMLIGLVVAAIESRLVAIALLGGRLVARPMTVHQAIARSRMVFWRSIGGAILAGIPLSITQFTFAALLASAVPLGGEGSFLAIILATALVGAPFTYIQSGIVLGDVDAVEAMRRSFRVYRARKVAAIVVALFETAAFLLILLGLSAGLDVALRVFDALGLGPGSGPAGLALVTAGVVVATFAFGTLLFTVTALSLAPQVVMFVGLTHATLGLDHVRAGHDHDPAVVPPGRRRFRLITRSMWLGIIVAWLVLLIVVELVAGVGG